MRREGFAGIRTRALLAATLAAAVMLTGCRPSVSEGADGAGAVVAPAFTLQQFSGSELSLRELGGRTVVLNFWASWCVPCREEMPLLEGEWRAQRGAGLSVVGVALDDDEQSLTSFLRAFDVTYPTGLDFDGRIARAYEVKGLPATFIISPGGKLIRRWFGPISRDRLNAFIAEAQ